MPTRVLIADDETVQRMDLKDMLTTQGYLVVGEASDGVSAVTQARQTRPDLAILDIRMLKMEGQTAPKTTVQKQLLPLVLLPPFGDQHLFKRAMKQEHFTIS